MIFILGIDPAGGIVTDDRPFGAQAEHRQPSTTINAAAQQEKRSELRRRKIASAYRKYVLEHNTINDILLRNIVVEERPREKVKSRDLSDATVSHFLKLTADNLKDFIHARKFTDMTFHKVVLTGTDGKLNKIRYKQQTAASIETDCIYE